MGCGKCFAIFLSAVGSGFLGASGGAMWFVRPARRVISVCGHSFLGGNDTEDSLLSERL